VITEHDLSKKIKGKVVYKVIAGDSSGIIIKFTDGSQVRISPGHYMLNIYFGKIVEEEIN